MFTVDVKQQYNNNNPYESIPVTMTLAVDRADTPVDCIGQQPLLYIQQIIHSLGLGQPVYKRIVNKIFPVPGQQ